MIFSVLSELSREGIRIKGMGIRIRIEGMRMYLSDLRFLVPMVC